MRPLAQDAVGEDAVMAAVTSAGASYYRGPELYEFLVEAELQQYFNGLRKDLKVNTVAQLKYVEEDDMRQIGMSKPEMRRLKKYFHKYCPQTYLRRIKKIILNRREDNGRTSISMPDITVDYKQNLRIPCKHMISADSITINKELGSGEFGIVQQGVWTNEEGDRIQVAIKRLSKEKMQNNSMDFLKEASIMHAIDSEHIVRLYGVVLETDALMLVTELAPLRSLLECLKEPALRPSFPTISLCEFALQICDGMQYLESKRLIHRDLAARNILVFSKNKVKISDFGLSRALGVGKNYYQTNFNVNLKLPIAWCAPECINYLRFTSASDVWAYGVTLWEMFSYGFQPWAALTGQQILEAIDEPNFHRLEQPECCPKDYYSLMLKCWQHDPNKRPKFSEIMVILPESKPEQVLAVKDFEEVPNSTPKLRRDFLVYRGNDVITVLDKKPLPDNPTLWKGVLCNGKTGVFNPANTVAYLGTDIPSMKPSFIRQDGKSGLYSSKRRLRTDMISRPQGDFKHTGHVGLDGAFFGDVGFLGDKYSQLPKQIVTPYKPQEDVSGEHASLTRTASDVSDRAPLISSNGGKSAAPLTSELPHWPESSGEKGGKAPTLSRATASGRRTSESPSSCGLTDHEYHEISEEEGGTEESKTVDSPVLEAYFQKLDFGPSLMDEVFTALNSRHDDEEQDELTRDETNNVRNEIKEIASKAAIQGGGGSLGAVTASGINGLVGSASSAAAASHADIDLEVMGTIGRKKRPSVKPISPSDAKALDSAIAIANEMATRNMLEMDSRSESDTAQDSPRTPSSPNKRKFSFRFAGAGKSSSSSPRAEKRNFTDEAASIPNIQESLTESAKEAYNSLVEKKKESSSNLVEPEETNPLRMLRSGMPVRPKIRGNKHSNGRSSAAPATTATPIVQEAAANGYHHHNHHRQNNHHQHQGQGSTGIQSQSMENVRLVASTSANCVGLPSPTSHFRADGIHGSTLPRSSSSSSGRHAHGPTVNGTSSNHTLPSTRRGSSSSREEASESGASVTLGDDPLGSILNPLPLPPRDRTKPIPAHRPRQRKHPLIIPTGNTRNLVKPSSLSSSMPDVNPASSHQDVDSCASGKGPLSPELSSPLASPDSPYFCSSPRQEAFLEARLLATSNGVPTSSTTTTTVVTSAPAKPPRLHNLDDSFDGQIQADMDSLDDIPEEEAPVPPMYRNSDHVSCEDLLDFACDFPNAKRTQGRARGIDSDEVRIMQKVLKSEVTPDDCVVALNETDWDVHKAIKYLKLQLMLSSRLLGVDNCKQTLISCSWDVQKAYNYLMATYGIVEDSTEV